MITFNTITFKETKTDYERNYLAMSKLKKILVRNVFDIFISVLQETNQPLLAEELIESKRYID